MVKRYAFWLGPDGRPFKGAGDKHAPRNILAEIGRTASTAEKGKISWHGFDLHRYELAVKSGFCVIDPDGRDLNEADAWAIGWRAIRTVITKQGGGTPLNPADVISEANKEASRFFRQPKERFFLVTDLSVAALPARSVRSSEAVISHLRSRGARFPVPGAALRQSSGSGYDKHLKESRYLLIKVDLSARSIQSAFQTGIESLNLALGLWNLALTRGSWSLIFGMRKPTLAAIRCGPLHTLHRPSGLPIDNVWWYDPDYNGDSKLYSNPDKWSKAEKERRWASRRIQLSPFRADLEALVVRYAEAVEQTNLAVAFLQLWALVEKITNTVGGQYDETIRRATWIYEDRPIVRELLEAARLRRNQFVHSAKSAEERDQLAYFIKGIVEDHLVRLISNRLRVSSLVEYSEFIRLGPNVDSLREERRRLARALAFLAK